jgi:AcrR family transcriptional regulator
MVLRATLEKKEEKERVRLELLRATLRLAAAHGFASLGLREVSREAGIAPTSFYRHFADMNELGLALIGDLVGPVIASLRATGPSTEQLLGALGDEMLAAVADDPELVRFLLAERSGAFPSFRTLLREQLSGLAVALRAAFKHVNVELPPLAAHAAVVLLLDALGNALDQDATGRAVIREQLVWSVQRLLG